VKASFELKLTSLFIFALAVLFYAFFMYAKHDPALSAVNGFADDPYDAVGSFGIQAAMFLGLLCLIRAFRPSRPDAASVSGPAFLARAQMAAVLSVAVTLAADLVAMLRHPAVWMGSPRGYKLLALLAGMAVSTATVGALALRQARKMDLPPAPRPWRNAVLVSLIASLTLFVYPDHFRQGLIGALFAVLAGDVILFASVWAWTMALMPYGPGAAPTKASRWFATGKSEWTLVILAGVLIGLVFVAGEASEGSGIPPTRLALVISVYIGLETAGLMIGYRFLGKPLGLFRKISP
jgi:hypothetical protein